jgi:hypothetical protein
VKIEVSAAMADEAAIANAIADKAIFVFIIFSLFKLSKHTACKQTEF